MQPISPDSIANLRSRLSFRLVVGTLFGLIVAGLTALIGVGVNLVGPAIPFWVPLTLGGLAGVFYVVAARPSSGERAVFSAATDSADEAATASPDKVSDSPKRLEVAASLKPVPADVVRLLGGRRIQVLGDGPVHMVMAPGQRIGLIAAAHLDLHPDAVQALAEVVATTREEMGLPIGAILVDLDNVDHSAPSDLVTVVARATVSAAAQKLPKFSAAQLMKVAGRAR
jgi:hypothetical protein